jgi:uncharacterized protein YecE (DUF72 family)
VRPVRVGCSGWQYRDWRGGLYPTGLPQRRWLERYAEVFDTVEVNSTFYRLAKPAAVARWVEQTPAGFTFAAKASRYLIHMRKLRDIDEGVRRFYAGIAPLADAGRLGPVLWQLPEWFAKDLPRLQEACGRLPAGRHCWEFRHPSWFDDDVYAVLAAHDMALAYGDAPHRPFQAHVATTDWTLVRFHFGTRGRRGNYSDREIDAWADRLTAWREREALWVYFNNDWEGFAVRNALRLRRELARRESDVENADPAPTPG